MIGLSAVDIAGPHDEDGQPDLEVADTLHLMHGRDGEKHAQAKDQSDEPEGKGEEAHEGQRL